MLKIGGLIKMQMYKKNIQQKDLARKLNLNQRTISSYCNNNSFPDLDTLSRICNILEIDLNKLLEIQSGDKMVEMVQDDKEYKLVEAFRTIPDEHKRDFLESFINLANLLSK